MGSRLSAPCASVVREVKGQGITRMKLSPGPFHLIDRREKRKRHGSEHGDWEVPGRMTFSFATEAEPGKLSYLQS